jgi:hypothetical protein
MTKAIASTRRLITDDARAVASEDAFNVGVVRILGIGHKLLQTTRQLHALHCEAFG